MPPRPPHPDTSSRRAPLVAILALATLAAAIPAPGLAQTSSGQLEIHPAQMVFEAGEPVRLVITNNGTTPAEGTPSIEIHHCPVQGLCAAQERTVHRWTGDRTQLAPGENMTVRWDRRTQAGDDAPEGTYEAHLRWNRTQGTDASADSERFRLENATQAQGDQADPQVTVLEPAEGIPVPSRNVSVLLRSRSSAGLDTVRVTVDEDLVADRQSIDGRWLNLSAEIELAPGPHILRVSARDDEGRVDRSTVNFTVAPGSLQSAGALRFRASEEGGLSQVRVDGRPLFDRVRTTEPSAELEPAPSSLALVLRAEQATTVMYDLNGTWTVETHPQGLSLEHPGTGERAIVVAVNTPIPRVEQGRLIAPLDAAGSLVIRPVTPAAGDAAIAEAILAGDVGAEVAIGADGDAKLVPYSSIDASVALREDQLTVLVSSPRSEGRSIVVHLPPEAPLGEGLEVRLDGQPVEATASLSDALDPADGDSEHHVVDRGGDRVLAASIASFSTRELVVRTAETVGAFLTAPAVLGAAALVALAGWGLFRRREP